MKGTKAPIYFSNLFLFEYNNTIIQHICCVKKPLQYVSQHHHQCVLQNVCVSTLMGNTHLSSFHSNLRQILNECNHQKKMFPATAVK